MWEIFKTCIAFLFYLPTYIHMLPIFAFCRIDDLTWGTKEEKVKQEGSAKVVNKA